MTHELLDEIAKHQNVDLRQDYALPIPVTVINEMVGVPDEDRSTFQEWMHLLIEGIGKLRPGAGGPADGRPHRLPA